MRAYFAIFSASIVAAVACGARTGLDVPPPPREHVDAGPDVIDAPPDVPPDVVDAPPDVPVIDECQDAGTTYIYLITQENELYSFYPPDVSNGNNGFTDIGPITCPTTMGNDTPFSMGVDRRGIAYSVFTSGNLFQFSTAHPDGCQATPYMPTQFGASKNLTFGMGFSANTSDPGETLYVASDDPQMGPVQPESLGTIDVKAFTLSTVGQLPKVIGSAELTGTGDGKLFGFGVDQPSGGPTTYRLIEFDKAKAGILSDIPLALDSGTLAIHAWAFAYWGGDFYFFTADTTLQHQTRVSKYHPLPGDTSAVATTLVIAENTIVGAGVSTCAPQSFP